MGRRREQNIEPYCLPCRHYRSIYGDGQQGHMACHYLLDVGVTRGCPFGKECDKRDTSKDKTEVAGRLNTNVFPQNPVDRDEAYRKAKEKERLVTQYEYDNSYKRK